jgi:hypothetical protein
MKTMSGAGSEERLRPDDRHRTCGAGADRKHGRGVVVVVSVEEYERLSAQSERADKGKTGTKGASKGGQ